MKYRRYGKFHFRDYYSGWFAIVFLFLIAVMSFLAETYNFLAIWPTILIVIMTWGIIEPNEECFSMSADIINVKKRKKRHQITMPRELTLVVSYADVCPSWAKRIGVGNSTYMLKGKYAVSILKKIPKENVLETLHGKYAYRYTNCWIEELLKPNFIYSFVCEQDMIEKIVSGRKCTLILPETLVDKINLNQLMCDIYIDKGF